MIGQSGNGELLACLLASFEESSAIALGRANCFYGRNDGVVVLVKTELLPPRG